MIVDTREQLPYSFSDRVVAVRSPLAAGDYSVEGFEQVLAVERKSAGDFVCSVIRERPRFRRELEKLRAYRAACVVVEASLADILAHRYHSGAHPNAVVGAALSIIVDYGIPVFFCSDRQASCRFTEGFLLRAHRRLVSECSTP
ncbi:MAG: ERCC4 domain-containing protein [Armatimonadota bacterium]